MKVIELFAGSRSFSKVASEEFGWETHTTDIEPFEEIDQVCDIFDFDLNEAVEDLGGYPDIVWASPPCTYFSVASIGHHWNKDNTPKTNEAYLGLKIIQETLDLIDALNPDYYYIENPRGKLRKLDVIQSVPIRRTVCYCKYGDDRMKPTDIWTNDLTWIPREMCHNGNTDCHHQPAPRGSRTGTQGYGSDTFNKSKIPYELCYEICENID